MRNDKKDVSRFLSPRLFPEVARDNKQCVICNLVGSQQNNWAIDDYDVMKPAGQERVSVALFRRCAEAMFTDEMGERVREEDGRKTTQRFQQTRTIRMNSAQN